MVLGNPRHRDCVNFKDGKCVLYGVAVPPEGPACPSFTPRTQASATEVATPATPLPRWGRGAGRGLGVGQGVRLGLGMRHRHRHGRGRRRWPW